jgi:zinc transporter
VEPVALATEAPLPEEALICGFQIPPTGPSRPLAVKDVRPALEAPEGVTWLHFRLSDARAERYLAESALFPPALRRRLEEHDAHTLLEGGGEGLMVVLTDFSFEHAEDTGEAAGLWGYATPRWFVSARTRALHSADALRLAVREGLRAESGFALVAALFELRNEPLHEITTRLADEVNDIEDEILRGDIKEQRQRLGAARRRCAHIRRHFIPDRNALNRLLARPPAWLSPELGERLRSAAEDLSHLLDDANELYERAKLLQEELAARLAEKTGDRLYVLSILSAVLLPMTLVTGVFGMNVAGLPGLAHEGAFFWTLLLILGSGGLTLWLLRWRKLL